MIWNAAINCMRVVRLWCTGCDKAPPRAHFRQQRERPLFEVYVRFNISTSQFYTTTQPSKRKCAKQLTWYLRAAHVMRM